MINRVVKLSFDPAQVENFQQLFENTKNTIAAFEGCRGVKLLRDTNATNVFFTYSLWESEEALNRYRQSDFFNKVWTQTKQWFNDKPMAWSTVEVNSYQYNS